MRLHSTIELQAGGSGSGCQGPNCGRPKTGSDPEDYAKRLIASYRAIGKNGYANVHDIMKHSGLSVDAATKALHLLMGPKGKANGWVVYTELPFGKKLSLASPGGMRIGRVKLVKDVKANTGGQGQGSEIGRKYYVVLKHDGSSPASHYPQKYDGKVVSEHNTPEEAETASLAMPYTRVQSEPRREETPEIRDIVRKRMVRTNPDIDS